MCALRLKGPIQLACGEAECWSCCRTTPVFTLEAADLKDLSETPTPRALGHPTFVYGITGNLPSVLKPGIERHAPRFKLTFSQTAGTYWANNCIHCGQLQGDHYMHSEPDGPFFGGAARFHGQRHLLTDKNIEVEAGSYGG